MSDPECQLEPLRAALEALDELVKAEAAALKNRNYGELETLAERKRACCQQLRALEPVLRSIEQLGLADGAPRVDPLHSSVLSLARRVRDSNAVNGKVILRLQQSTLDLLGILGGSEFAPLYGATGQQTSEVPNAPIARA